MKKDNLIIIKGEASCILKNDKLDLINILLKKQSLCCQLFKDNPIDLVINGKNFCMCR